jgi:hypothetical protein
MKHDRILRKHLGLSTLIAALLAAGCGGGGGGDGGGGGTDTGTLSLSVTDAPVDDAESVVVEFTGVEVHSAGGETLTFDFDAPRSIDLLDLANGESVVLFEDELAAGDYEWIRLKVNAEDDEVLDTFITIDDDGDSTAEDHEMTIPSGSQSGLKLNRPFTVNTDGTVAFTIDFDLRKSVHKPAAANQDYKLRPTLRIVDSTVVGNITGMVDATLLADAACTDGDGGLPENSGLAVYAFAGPGVAPDDVDGLEPEPVSTAIVEFSDSNGDSIAEYHYTLAFLEPGTYTVALTCDADLDDPETDDALVFTGTSDVTVTEGADTTHDFLP